MAVSGSSSAEAPGALETTRPTGNAATSPASARRICVGLCDRHTLIRSAIEELLRPEPDMEIVWSVEALADAFAPSSEGGPDILLIDFSRPTEPFLAQVGQFRTTFPETQIVALTDHGSDECNLFAEQPPTFGLGQPRTCCLQQAFMLGARGAIGKTSTRGELLRVIRGVCDGHVMVEEPSLSILLSRLFGQSQPEVQQPHLTKREQEVIQSLALGKSNKEIGAALGMQEQTVKNHISHILGKLGLEDRVQIVVFAARYHLISLDEL